MHDTELMEILDAGQYLVHELAGLLLLNSE